jgi:hypothetical protein
MLRLWYLLRYAALMGVEYKIQEMGGGIVNLLLHMDSDYGEMYIYMF